MRVLLDTQLIYLASVAPNLDGIPAKTLKVIEDSATERLISAASIMEVALKLSTASSIIMTEEQLQQAVRDLYLTIIPFTPEHAYRLFTLPLHHKDPFDRMIIATALSEDIPLIGGDRIFKKYAGLKVLWR
jgi:PIN domain nuclease of toxin-antitoxin system